jgi:hypothetical protein
MQEAGWKVPTRGGEAEDHSRLAFDDTHGRAWCQTIRERVQAVNPDQCVPSESPSFSRRAWAKATALFSTNVTDPRACPGRGLSGGRAVRPQRSFSSCCIAGYQPASVWRTSAAVTCCRPVRRLKIGDTAGCNRCNPALRFIRRIRALGSGWAELGIVWDWGFEAGDLSPAPRERRPALMT